ncbi:peptidylprolyl isomerase [Roseiterribacter gracilis]|uniref:Parvulin-like PPIase n=1 Tax=Roseiterribacter gracilis TaxID=2812848 RepID=A0A8S8X9M0_9PROT|nr:chaperone SurA [Rhodospirillales bacterium TMPK1]
MTSRNFLAAAFGFALIAAPLFGALSQDAWAATPRERERLRVQASNASGDDDVGTFTLGGKIAAVVNEDAISVEDLDARLKLALISSQLPDNPEVKARLKPQVLRNLIEEQLEVQEAKRLNIRVERSEVDQAIENVAKANGMTREQFEGRFKQSGIPLGTLRNQALAQIAWAKVIQKQIRPRVDINQEEVDDTYEKLRQNAGKPQYLMAEIYLAVDNPSQEASVQSTATRLVDEIKRGANFGAVARQFSQSADAANGGDLGWVQEGQLGEEIDKTIREMRPGILSAPVRAPDGYHILYMRDRGTVLGANEGGPREQQGPSPNDRLVLKQILLPPPQSQAEADKLIPQIKHLIETVQGCAAIDERAKTDKLSGTLGNNIRLRDLPPQVQQAVASVPEGRLSTPLQTPAGIALLMVCKRISGTPENVQQTVVQTAPKTPQMPSKDQVLNQIGLQRLELQARRYLRDLRAQAFVDVRV